MTRDARIAEARRMRSEGLLLREIAERFGVSESTVLRWTDDEYAKRARAVCRARKLDYRGTCRDCGAPTVGDAPGQAPECCRPCRHKRTRADSRRWILDSFREWHALFGEAPKAWDWNPAQARVRGREDLVARHEATGRPWPSPTLVIDHFGSWNAGIEAAGFPPVRVGSYRDESKRREILRAAAGTDRRREDIARMWAEGLTGREIANAMGVAESTVRGHITAMRAEGWDLPRRWRPKAAA